MFQNASQEEQDRLGKTLVLNENLTEGYSDAFYIDVSCKSPDESSCPDNIAKEECSTLSRGSSTRRITSFMSDYVGRGNSMVSPHPDVLVLPPSMAHPNPKRTSNKTLLQIQNSEKKLSQQAFLAYRKASLMPGK